MKTSRILLWSICAVLAAGASLQADTKPLVAGDQAPLFNTHDQDGNKWSLADHLRKGMVLLYFYPKDDTAGCSSEACGLRDNMFELKQSDVDVVGVSFDNKQTHKDFVFKYNLDFPLLPDAHGHIADAYGTRMGTKNMDRRVSFLIGMDGKIIHITDSPDPSVHLKELAETLAGMRHSQIKTR
jgi:thioredoxin-dependent peroxiredoxin